MTPPKHTVCRLSRHAAFTLIEIMVAMAVLVVLLLMVVGLVNSTASLTAHANKRISAEQEARQVLDRISKDLERIVLRSDLGQRIEKLANADDTLSFYAQVKGYEGDRGLTRISYKLSDGRLVREASGTFWNSADGQQAPFHTTNLPATVASESEVIGPHVFRYEVAFLMGDGRIQASVPAFTSTNASNQVRAIIVGVAVLEEKSRKIMTGDISDLGREFGDATNNQDIQSLWGSVISDSAFYPNPPDPEFPNTVRAAVRVYQRYYFLN